MPRFKHRSLDSYQTIDQYGNSQNAWLGAAWKVLAFSCYAGLNALARYLSGGVSSDLPGLPVNVIIFFQDFFALLIVAPWVLRHKQSFKKPRFLGLHLFRVLISASAIISWYFALYFLPLADAVALSIIGPLLGVIGATLFLKERPSKRLILMMMLTFIGAVILIRPLVAFSNHADNFYGLMCVGISSICFAMAKIATRKLASLGESRRLLTIYLLVLIVPVTFVLALLVWVTPSVAHLPWLLAAGALTALALYAVTSALAYAQVSFLAPFDCLRFILNASIGYVAFTELPQLWFVWLLMAVLLLVFSSARFGPSQH